MSTFDSAIAFVLNNEKGLHTESHDHGKIKNFGLSLRFLYNMSPEKLKKYGIFECPTVQTIRDLNEAQARRIYYSEFWVHAPFEKILNQRHCNFIFYMAVNSGISAAIKCLQRACWSVMRNRSLVDDGILGEKTLTMLNERCGLIIMPAIRSECAGYYRLILDSVGEDDELLEKTYCAV